MQLGAVEPFCSKTAKFWTLKSANRPIESVLPATRIPIDPAVNLSLAASGRGSGYLPECSPSFARSLPALGNR